MKEIYVEHIGTAFLVENENDLPCSIEFIAAFDGYRFFKTPDGLYATEE